MRRIGRVLLPVLFWLGVWQLAAAAVGQELLLPGPAAVGRRLLELAAGADDYFELTADRLKGAVSLQRGPDRDQILEFSLALTLGNGETVKLRDIGVMKTGCNYTARDADYRIEKRLLNI